MTSEPALTNVIKVSKLGLPKARSRGHRDVPAVELRNVELSYDEQKILDQVSFKVMCGEIKIILSSSGGGKSTILKLILGLIKPDGGEVFVDGQEITRLAEDKLQHARDQIGMVFQDNALFDSLSVYDNVAYRLSEHGVPEVEIDAEVSPILRFVNLESMADRLPSELSGGMQKRVSIARALIGNPGIILFDEPTAFLDPITAATICDLIITLRDVENVASVVVTHEMKVVKHVLSEHAVIGEKGGVRIENDVKLDSVTNTSILMLKKGRVIFDGKCKDFVNSKDPYIHNFIRGTEIDPTVKHVAEDTTAGFPPPDAAIT